jgi:hypothetical protein
MKGTACLSVDMFVPPDRFRLNLVLWGGREVAFENVEKLK